MNKPYNIIISCTHRTPGSSLDTLNYKIVNIMYWQKPGLCMCAFECRQILWTQCTVWVNFLPFIHLSIHPPIHTYPSILSIPIHQGHLYRYSTHLYSCKWPCELSLQKVLYSLYTFEIFRFCIWFSIYCFCDLYFEHDLLYCMLM